MTDEETAPTELIITARRGGQLSGQLSQARRALEENKVVHLAGHLDHARNITGVTVAVWAVAYIAEQEQEAERRGATTCADILSVLKRDMIAELRKQRLWAG